ncbi:MAG: phosphate acyltransferase PlsX [Actinobacteria bacterium]|nr:phosphate acyltransferase PlsX [Actinomycetota bacterium]
MAQSRPVTIALDGYGAEQGFDVLAEGARRAAADGIGVRVFGPERSLGLQGVDGIEVIPTTDWIGNDDDAVQSVRERKEASVVRAARDVADGNAAAMVSLGSTGATMAAATFGLRRLKGVQRPALAVRLPSPIKPVLFLDVGANVEVRAQHLVQFAFLGAAFAAAVLETREPTVGLLTVGEEAGKGRPEIVEAHRILAGAPGIDFAGNIEGGDLPEAKVDVVVTDGFTGNVALKVMEGAARTLAGAISDLAHKNVLAAAGGLLLKPALGGLRKEFDPDTTGGAILLGLRAVTIVGHGSSGPDGVANAVRLAARSVKVDAVGRTAALLREGGAGRAALADEAGDGPAGAGTGDAAAAGAGDVA